MEQLILNTPMPVRLGFLFVLGAITGGQLNRGIYRLAWHSRDTSPWSRDPSRRSRRRWLDRVPILGWLGLRREASVRGAGFWIRPMLIELGTATGFALLYWLEVHDRILWPNWVSGPVPSALALHGQYFSHVILLSLMIVATFIDFDEQTIPDEITVTGTLAALVLALLVPWSALPTLFTPLAGAASAHYLVLTSSNALLAWRDGLGGPSSWPISLDHVDGLATALFCVWGWCFAILHKTWTLRHGVRKAFGYLLASIVRRRTWPLPLTLGLLLSTLVLFGWAVGGPRWESLLSALVGMAFGGGLIWAVRIVGGHALRAEAMGFGDVTLMAMIGAFLGWQPALLIFFAAPFSALVIALAQWLLTGDRHIAFGPYLCVSALLIILGWRAVWYGWAMPMFSLGVLIPGMVVCCLILMGGLLWLWRLAREAMFVES